ncbi:MAG: alpha/beta fold hydrolase [Armatimonadia bacterium]|nr:alpha/beta fold hydrolase [Armatimonadia bacterium]
MTSDVSMERYPRIDEGSGTPVLFLHGIFGSPENWGETAEQLVGKYRMIRLEFPIFSTAPRKCNVNTLTTYVEQFLQESDMEPPVVVGNSLGGHVALDLALRRPDLVRALTLTGSSGLFERGFEKGVPRHPDRDWIADRLGHSIFYDPGKLTDEMVDEAMDVLESRENRLRLIRIAASAKRSNLAEELHQVSVPTLLVWGRQDRVTPLEVAEQFEDSIPRARLVLVDECGHAPMLEQPRAFTMALEEFLGDLERVPEDEMMVP